MDKELRIEKWVCGDCGVVVRSKCPWDRHLFFEHNLKSDRNIDILLRSYLIFDGENFSIDTADLGLIIDLCSEIAKCSVSDLQKYLCKHLNLKSVNDKQIYCELKHKH